MAIAIGIGIGVPFGSQTGFPSTITDGTISMRKVVRDGYLCTDLTIAGRPLGFAGVEDTDWECVESVVFDGSSWWETNLWQEDEVNFWAVGRSGLTMPDSVGSNDVSILTPTYKGTATAELNGAVGAEERFFDGVNHTLYFKFNRHTLNSATQYFMIHGNWFNATRGLSMGVSGTGFYLTAGDGVNSCELNLIADVNATLTIDNWYEAFIEVDFDTKRLRTKLFKQSDGSSVGVDKNQDISTWTFNTNNNGGALRLYPTFYALADFKKFTGLKTIAQCRDNSYVTDLQYFYPTLHDGTDVSGAAHHLTRTGIKQANLYYSNISTYCLDYGFYIYRHRDLFVQGMGSGSYDDMYIPNNPVGVEIARSIADRDKVESHTGSLTKHNCAESKMTITGWDKSDTNIFEDAVRSSVYYDAANVNDWHINELDYLTFSQNCKANYKGLRFFKFTDNSFVSRRFLSEFFDFTTDKSGSDLTKIITYTGDASALNAAIKLICDASVNDNIWIKLIGITGSSAPKVYWGDGTKDENMLMDSATEITKAKHYAGVTSYTVYIFNAASILSYLSYYGGTVPEFAPLNSDITEFSKLANATIVNLQASATPYIGTIDGFNKGITTLNIYNGAVGVTGDITPFIALKHLHGVFACSGSLTNTMTLIGVFLDGNTTISTDITGHSVLEGVDSYATGAYWFGSVTGCTKLKQICCGLTPNAFTGSITDLADFEYLDNYGGSTLTGDLTGKVKIWNFKSGASSVTHNAFTGIITGLTALEQLILNDDSTVTKPATLVNSTKLAYFGTKWVYTETEVNQYLADIWANRNAARRVDVVNRQIMLNTVGSHEPTGQGIVDKANLEAYRSPTPPGTAALWTIDTN